MFVLSLLTKHCLDLIPSLPSHKILEKVFVLLYIFYFYLTEQYKKQVAHIMETIM